MMRIKEWFLSSSLNTRAVDMLRIAHLPLHNLHTTCWERKAVVEDTEHHLRIWICQDKVPISAVLCYQQQRLTNLMKGNGETMRVNKPLMLFKLNHASNIKSISLPYDVYLYEGGDTHVGKQ